MRKAYTIICDADGMFTVISATGQGFVSKIALEQGSFKMSVNVVDYVEFYIEFEYELVSVT